MPSVCKICSAFSISSKGPFTITKKRPSLICSSYFTILSFLNPAAVNTLKIPVPTTPISNPAIAPTKAPAPKRNPKPGIANTPMPES